MIENKIIRVLVVDDQAIVRDALDKGLSADPQIAVVDRAPDPYIARDKIVRLKPDVITLDVEMPRMNGIDFLKKLMQQFPIPVVMVSTLTQKGKMVTLEALEAGAIDFVQKPDGSEGSFEAMILELREKIKAAAKADLSQWQEKRRHKIQGVRRNINTTIGNGQSNIKVIAIGASTGGTVALSELLADLPEQMPGIVIVQHMPSGFTRLFAERLNGELGLEVKEAANGDIISPGRVLVAPGDFQMAVKRDGNYYRVSIFEYERVSGHRPSVDVLFDSLAGCSEGFDCIGVILTGMGSDGAKGLLKMKNKGASTIAQDEQSCVVYGMPKVAVEMGAVKTVLPLENIAGNVVQHCFTPDY